MSKLLVLIRHGKATPVQDADSDFDRSLIEKGIENTELIASKLLEKSLSLDLILSSPAKRAHETAVLIANKFGYNQEAIQLRDELLEDLKTSEFIALLSQYEEEFNTIFVVGHNPMLEKFASKLCKKFKDELPTSAAVGITFDETNWNEIQLHKGKLTFFEYPKKNNK